MILINYPEPIFRVKKEGSCEYIFDSIRKRWIVLTPEEWVRQNFIQYLVRAKNYPATLIAVEKEIRLGELVKRFDILVYNKDHKPFMLVECKGAEISVNEKVLEQILRYNLSTPVEYIIITNGNVSYGWHRGEGGLQVLNEVPEFA